MGLVRELLLLICILILLFVILIINLSLFREISTSKPTEQIETAIAIPVKPIQNRDGMKLFKDNCATCHNRNMRNGLVGPALGGVRERWKNRDVELYSFIRNSQKVINGGNDYARDLFQKWQTEMPPFTSLKDDDIQIILDYIEEAYNR